MIDTLKKYKKTLIIIGVIIASFIVYSAFLKPDNTEEGIVSSGPDQQPKAGREILSLLVDLKEIDLNAELFQSNSFRNLNDFSTPIPPEPKGRPNPFAPIGQDRQISVEGDIDSKSSEAEVTEGGSGTGN